MPQDEFVRDHMTELDTLVISATKTNMCILLFVVIIFCFLYLLIIA